MLVFIFRRRIDQMQIIKGPNKILLTLEDVTFINPSLSNKVSGKGSKKNFSVHIKPNIKDRATESFHLLASCLFKFSRQLYKYLKSHHFIFQLPLQHMIMGYWSIDAANLIFIDCKRRN